MLYVKSSYFIVIFYVKTLLYYHFKDNIWYFNIIFFLNFKAPTLNYTIMHDLIQTYYLLYSSAL